MTTTPNPTKRRCDHKCHICDKGGLNPWVEACPICGCPNKDYDPKAEVPGWVRMFHEGRFPR